VTHPNQSLVWITQRQAVNPANILWLFRGAHGEIEIMFGGGKLVALNERELSADGRALLLRPEDQGAQLRLSTTKAEDCELG
jgi:hypothetical protein